MFDFFNFSVTPWHAAEKIAAEFLTSAFVELRETEAWKLEQGKAYFVKRGAAVFAFRVPTTWTKNSRVILASAHTDFPA